MNSKMPIQGVWHAQVDGLRVYGVAIPTLSGKTGAGTMLTDATK
jgi:hypothetical protein